MSYTYRYKRPTPTSYKLQPLPNLSTMDIIWGEQLLYAWTDI